MVGSVLVARLGLRIWLRLRLRLGLRLCQAVPYLRARFMVGLPSL